MRFTAGEILGFWINRTLAVETTDAMPRLKACTLLVREAGAHCDALAASTLINAALNVRYSMNKEKYPYVAQVLCDNDASAPLLRNAITLLRVTLMRVPDFITRHLDSIVLQRVRSSCW